MPKYLVTSALPYANGPIHLGHLAGAYLPADIFVRYLRLDGQDVVYICGTDEHGVPITIRAEKEKITPGDVVDRYHREIKSSFERMSVDFDNFSGTSRFPRHNEISQRFFLDLLENGHIETHSEEQFYCPHDKRFLPDRYVEGVCPSCGFERARGDQCDKCGKLLNPVELVNPKCALCGNVPELRTTSHWYLRLQDFEKRLVEWLSSKKEWKENVRNFMLGWIQTEGLRERAITRDIDWGIPVPLPGAEGKVLYVWFDAPIGYISSTVEWAQKIGKPDLWKDYWCAKDTRLVHFIGKDNIPFHAVIWPAMLMGQNGGYVMPFDIPANEYLTLEGDKFSTSMNWAVWVDEYLENFPADPLRYCLAANAPETKDADFSWKSFQARNNDELANILGNFANRTLTFVNNFCSGKVPEAESGAAEDEISRALAEKITEIKRCFSSYKVREACRVLMDIARLGNKYFDEQKPWALRKDSPDRLAAVMAACMNILRVLSVAMFPIMPTSAGKLWAMIGEKNDITAERWDDLAGKRIAAGQAVGKVEILFGRFEDDVIQAQVDKLIAKSKAAKESNNKGGNKMEAQSEAQPAVEITPVPAGKPQITIDEFGKVELRVAEVISAVAVEKSNKLVKLQVKVGETQKQILAGIRQHYPPETLVGRKIIIVNNLVPAKLMGEVSEGMVLAAGTEDKSVLSVLVLDKDMPSGAKIS
jgi:methionyl-tRNA synthetase